MAIGPIVSLGVILSYSCYTETDKGVDQKSLGLTFAFFTLIIVLFAHIIPLKVSNLERNRLKLEIFQIICLIVSILVYSFYKMM